VIKSKQLARSQFRALRAVYAGAPFLLEDPDSLVMSLCRHFLRCVRDFAVGIMQASQFTMR